MTSRKRSSRLSSKPQPKYIDDIDVKGLEEDEYRAASSSPSDSSGSEVEFEEIKSLQRPTKRKKRSIVVNSNGKPLSS